MKCTQWSGNFHRKLGKIQSNMSSTTMSTIFIILCAALAFQQVDAIGYTYPKGTIEKLVNDTIRIICTIDMTSSLSEGKNSSYLSFSNILNEPVNSSYIQILNETSIALTIPNAPPMIERFTCKLNTIHGVSYNNVYVGYKPSAVKDFKCRSHNWENLNCTFEESPYNPVVPKRTLHFSVDSKPPKSKRHKKEPTNPPLQMYECYLEGKEQQYWCFLEFDSPKGHYRQSYEFYYFVLFSSNVFGNITENFTIRHYESVIPAAPEELNAVNTTSNSAIIKWKIPYKLTNFPRNLIHEVKYWSDFNKVWKSLDPINDNLKAYEITLKNLEYAYAWYDVRVRIKVDGAPDTEEMWSPYAAKIFRTESRIPDDPPETNIGGFHVNDNDHIFIYWKELPVEKNNGPNLHYNITVNNGPIILIHPEIQTHTMAKYEKLRFNQQYEFSVYSVNSLGYSMMGSKIRVPPAEKRCLPPRHIKKILYKNSYEISWSAPIFDDNIVSYTVFFCVSKNDLPNQCDGSIDFREVNKTVNNFTYPSREALNFAVSANSRTSSSGMIWALCTALPNNDIGKLSTIWINKMQPTFIEFKWNLNCIDRTILEGYILTYCPINDPKILDCKEPEKRINVTSDAKSYNLTGLSPYTTYKTVISMYSAQRVGPPCEPLVNTTLEAAPSPPRNLRFRDVTNTSVTLFWDPPEHINGVLMKYKVWYNGNSRSIDKRDSTKMELVLDNLASFTEFEIVILACTVACSEASNSIKIKTEIGVPGELRQANITDSDGIRIEWKPPAIKAGLLQYYELTAKITGEHGVYEQTVQINGTHCTMQLETCLRGSDKYEFSVRAVNVVQSPHAKPIQKRETLAIDDNYNDVSGETVVSNKGRGFIKRHSSIDFDITNATIQIVNSTNGKDNVQFNKKKFDSRGQLILCQEQDDAYLRRYLESDKYSVHLRGESSVSSFYNCKNSTNSSGLFVLIVVGLFGMAAITLVSYMVMKKFKKMKDISVELPAGLEDIKEESKGKHLHLDCSMNKSDITRSDELLCSSEQEESLLRNRMESGSSNNTENNSSCEYNEAVDDSESEHQNEDESSANTISENIDIDKSSPAPLLPILVTSTAQSFDPSIMSQPTIPKISQSVTVPPPAPVPLSSSNYVPASMLMRPAAASNGYVSHEAVMGKPASSGYVPWSSVGTKAKDSSDDFKSKTPIVTSTDVQGISGYVTHKQLSDFGQLMH